MFAEGLLRCVDLHTKCYALWNIAVRSVCSQNKSTATVYIYTEDSRIISDKKVTSRFLTWSVCLF